MRWPWSKKPPQVHKLRQPIERHLKIDIAKAQSLSHDITPVERLDLQRVLDRWIAESNPPARELGYSTTGFMADDGLMRHLVTDQLIQAPVERTQIDCGPGNHLDCLLRGLLLINRADHAVLIAFRPPRITRELPVVEVVAATRQIARETLADFAESNERNVECFPQRCALHGSRRIF